MILLFVSRIQVYMVIKYDNFINRRRKKSNHTSLIDKQVIDIARHVSLKHQALLALLQSEVSYVNDLFIFHESFGLRLKAWVDNTSDKDVITKVKNTPTREDLNILLSCLHEIATIHASLLEDLKERYLERYIALNWLLIIP